MKLIAFLPVLVATAALASETPKPWPDVAACEVRVSVVNLKDTNQPRPVQSLEKSELVNLSTESIASMQGTSTLAFDNPALSFKFDISFKNHEYQHPEVGAKEKSLTYILTVAEGEKMISSTTHMGHGLDTELGVIEVAGVENPEVVQVLADAARENPNRSESMLDLLRKKFPDREKMWTSAFASCSTSRVPLTAIGHP